jgi:Tfp pilus assembly protein PilN
MRPANLARRPFRNERLPNLLIVLAIVVAAAVTVRHALAVRTLMPARTSALHEEVARLEAEEKRLRSDQVSLRELSPEPEALARWILVKDLVDRRAFSWTGLFARLEEKLPEGARVVSIAPSLRGGAILLEVQAVMRTPEVGWEFMRALEEGGGFADVFPLSEGADGAFRYTMRYRPRPEPPLAAAPAPPRSAREAAPEAVTARRPSADLRAEGRR